jgi:hypothetical protein
MRLLLLMMLTLVGACSGGSTESDDAAPGPDSATDAGVDVAPDIVTADSGPGTVTFAYAPQWTTVTGVSVYGRFGLSTDWKKPFVTLTADGAGNFTGSATLPAGQYSYIFEVDGDDAASDTSTYTRYAIDTQNPSVTSCPTASPTYDANNNPCSQLTVPQPAPPTLVHLKGLVVSDGVPIAGYLVELDRSEKTTHHFFTNRMTTGSDGSYDLVAAPGSYQLQVLYRSFLSDTDLQRDPPTTLAAVRRDYSQMIPAMSTVVMPNAEVAFHAYPTFSPTGSATLPTDFAFTGQVSKPTRLAVYPAAMGGANIGDPWYLSPMTSSGSASFDGGFNTPQALQKSAASGERYFWGIEEDLTNGDAGAWTAQSMVFDVTWH